MTLEQQFEKLWEDNTLTNESFFNSMIEIAKEFAVKKQIEVLEKILNQKNYEGVMQSIRYEIEDLKDKLK